MSSIELKSNFHRLIDIIQDERMLQDLYDCVADFAIVNDSKLSASQIEWMQQSMSQIEKGQVISNEEGSTGKREAMAYEIAHKS